MELFNKKTFGSLKRSITKSGLSLQGNVQRIIEQGLSHYLETGDTVYLNQAMAIAIATKTIRTIAMQAYIQHVANVFWTEVKQAKGKIRVFKKVKNEDGTKPLAEVNAGYVAETTWFDHASDLGQDKVDMDFNAQFLSLKTRTQKAQDDGRLGDVDLGKVQETLVELVGILGLELDVTPPSEIATEIAALEQVA